MDWEDGSADPSNPVLGVSSLELEAEVVGRLGRGSAVPGLAVVAGLALAVGLLWFLGTARWGDEAASTAPADPGSARSGGVDPPASGFSLDAGSVPESPEPRASIAVTPAAPPSTIADGRPVLDLPTGLALFYGGEAPLQRVDLDTGRLAVFGIRAHPVLVTGSTLVLRQPDADLVGWVPLADPGQQAKVWKRGRVTGGSEPGQLWVLDPAVDERHPAGAATGSGRWELFDLTEDRVVRRLPGDLHDEVEVAADAEPPVGGVFDALGPPPLLSTRPDGVHRHGEDGYRRLAAGRALVDDAGVGLVASGSCSSGDSCDLVWIDVATGGVVDRPLPGGRPRVAAVVGGGRWLHTVDWDGRSELLELGTGRRIEHTWATDRPTISPDGRWLAEWFGTTVVISDLDGGGPPRTAGWVDGFERDGPGSLVFAPSG
jgi:hypothetical protein